MEPCQFCGQYAAVDGAGFCTNCRNYRGVPTAAPGPVYPTSAPSYGGQVSAPPVTGAPYPVSGGYPPQQYSAPPAYQQPAPPYQQSAPPYQQSAPYQQPAPYQPTTAAPAKQRSGFVVPIIALCSVLVLLVIGIVVVVVVKHKPSGSGGDTGLTAAGLDKCLVGTWTVTTYDTSVPFDNVGSVDFTGKDLNEKFTIDEDGKARDDYGTINNPTVLTGTSTDHDYEIDVYGSVTYTIKSANGVLSFSDSSPDGELELLIDGDSAGTTDLDISSDPTPYTCSSTTITQKTADFSLTATRS